MKTKKKVLLVFDAAGPTTLDQDFSEELKTQDWKTERDVIKAIRKLDYDLEILGIHDNTEIITEKVARSQPDIIFNLVESFAGYLNHDRDIASFFKLKHIPFTGCGPTGLTLCKNKGLSKQILSYHRIRVPQFVMLQKDKPIHRPAKLHFPILIKPLNEEASYGISQASFVENDDQFNERVKFIHEKMEKNVIAEEYIDGRELYVSVIGNKRLTVFPIRELKFREVPDDEPKIATYKAKWDMEYRKRWGIRNEFVRSLPNGTKEKIEKLSKKIYRLLSCRGYARLDLRLTEDGRVYFIEANPNPILDEWEDFAESACKTGMKYSQLIDRIIKSSSLHLED